MNRLSLSRYLPVVLLSVIFLPIARVSAANPPAGGDVLINEYVANSSVTEWVELYNTTASDLDLSGHYIDDLQNAGGAPKLIPNGTIIPAGGYYVMEFSNFLNNGGDDVRFLDPAQNALDSTSYNSATAEYSWYRTPDGGTWSGTESDSPTKGTANPGSGVNAPGPGDVLINEFTADSATTEWVELYNTTANDLDISNHYIDDIDGGGAPRLIPANTIIPAGGFYVMDFTGLLNNGGDDVRFLDPAQAVLDSTSYTYSTAEYSWYRYRDGLAWSPAEIDAPTKNGSNNNMGAEPWTPGEFQIRIFDVEQGDSQLIIFPSGYTILIDVVEHAYNSDKGAALIASKIQSIKNGDMSIDVGVASHLHLDHIGYAGFGGFWGLIETYGVSFGKLVDRDAGVWVDGSGGGANDGLCDADFEIVWHNAGTVSGTSRNWLCYVTNPANAVYNIREIAQVGSTTQIDPPDAGAVVEIVQADAQGIMMVDGVTPLQGDHTGISVPPSENDYSIGLKIRFGQIDYATSGDSDGEYATSSFGYTYNDVETDLADRFGPVDVLRANHHGSGHSTNQYYVDTLDPAASAISCGDNSFGHPGQAVLDRLLATGDVWVTNLCDTTRNYGSAVLVHGDIVLKSTDGLNFTINGTSYVATDPAGSGTVADIVINEFLARPSSGNPEWVELYNPTGVAIDLSGAWIDDSVGGGAPKQIPNGTSI
ncbi:MAG: lamin tail domain-containing protein, partial [Ardenticatenales bacterium]|nr:lamin tail domain-containing protein [Ardenticatenales bacterium]